MNCSKCRSGTAKEGTWHHEGGKSYYLCAFCHHLMEQLPSNIFSLFMQNDSSNIPEIASRLNPNDLSMLIARERRANNNGWISNVQM